MTADHAPSTPEQIASMTDRAREVIQLNIEALQALERTIDASVARACDVILSRPGYVVVTGMGKSGHIGGKIAATLASTGTNAFFVHPAEMSHGDLGMLREDCTLLAISASGESRELRDPLIFCQRNNIPVIGMTQRSSSFLARMSAVPLVMPNVAEACPNGLAPTTSTLMTLALGDALAVCVMQKRNFRPVDFKVYHPGGKLGAQLLTVTALMHAGEAVPLIGDQAAMGEALLVMTAKSFGVVGVTDAGGALIGIITDGDLRRHMDGLMQMKACDVMSRHPRTIRPEALAVEALGQMNERKITCLFATDAEHKPVGLIHIHDCLRAGVA